MAGHRGQRMLTSGTVSQQGFEVSPSHTGASQGVGEVQKDGRPPPHASSGMEGSLGLGMRQGCSLYCTIGFVIASGVRDRVELGQVRSDQVVSSRTSLSRRSPLTHRAN